MKKRVTGIGGVFFKAKDPDKIRKWYERHLGFPYDRYGCSFEWVQKECKKPGHTAWSPFSEDTQYYTPSTKDFMFNYRVENLEELLKILKDEGVQVVGEMETHDYGKFGWIMDPEGNKIELWEPVDMVYNKMVEGKSVFS